MRYLPLLILLCCSCPASSSDVAALRAEVDALKAERDALKQPASAPAPTTPQEVSLRLPMYPPALVGIYRPAAGNALPWDEICFDPATLRQWFVPLQRGMSRAEKQMRGAD